MELTAKQFRWERMHVRNAKSFSQYKQILIATPMHEEMKGITERLEQTSRLYCVGTIRSWPKSSIDYTYVGNTTQMMMILKSQRKKNVAKLASFFRQVSFQICSRQVSIIIIS